MQRVEALPLPSESTDASNTRWLLEFCIGYSGIMLAHLTKPMRQSELYRCLAGAEGEWGPAPPGLPTAMSESDPALVGRRVLLAEDNRVNCEVARTMLEGFGCLVETAVDGREAVAAVARNWHDVILMDCQMPEMDGFAATAEIRRAEEKRGRRVPIIALTANAMTGDRERCLAAGMDDYLAKPFDQKQLHATLRRWIGSPGQVPSHPTGPGALSAAHSAAARNGARSVEGRTLDRLRALQQKGATGLLSKLIGLYLADSPPLLAAMRAALARGDADALGRAAHTLKSSSANLGATRLTELCLAVEVASRAGAGPDLGSRIDAIDAEYHSVECALQEELHKSS